MSPWSWSHLNAFEQCPRKYHHYYVLRDVPWETSPEMSAGSVKHKELEEQVNRGELIDAKYRPQTEVRLGITESGAACGFWDADVWGRGVVDVLVTTDAPLAYILDWKTGKTREDPDELATHAVFVKAHYPHVESIHGRFVWLKENRLGRLHDLSDTEVKLEKLRATVATIAHQLKMDYMPPKEGPLCAYCRVKSCQFNKSGTRK